MLNLQICTVKIMTKKKKMCRPRDLNPGRTGPKSEIHLQFHYTMEANANYREK